MSNSVSVQQLVVSELNSVLPNKVMYDLFLGSDIGTPCISYMVSGESDNILGNTLNYGAINFTVKLWCDNYPDIISYTTQISDKMRTLGFKLSGSNELAHQKLICKILNFNAATQFGSDAWY